MLLPSFIKYLTIGESEQVKFNDVPPASYVLRIVIRRPGKRIVERRVVHVLGQFHQVMISIMYNAQKCSKARMRRS